MLDGLLLLLTLSAVITMTSYLAGLLPLSQSLSPLQIRIMTNLGMGFLVGTSLIVIIPEGIESIYSVPPMKESYNSREDTIDVIRSRLQWIEANIVFGPESSLLKREDINLEDIVFASLRMILEREESSIGVQGTNQTESGRAGNISDSYDEREKNYHHALTFSIGLSLICGFVLMFLVDKLFKKASESLLPSPPTRHISLTRRGLNSPSGETTPESEPLLNSLTRTSRHVRSFVTTSGLIIHGITDGISIGTSICSSNLKFGLIIFIAIILHKAPAAFGLTSILLKQGLNERDTRTHLIFFSLATPVGAIITWAVITILGASNVEGNSGRWWTGILLLFSAGTFLYVSVRAMHEENAFNYGHSTSDGDSGDGSNILLQQVSQVQVVDSIAAIFGMLLPLLVAKLLDPHH